MSRRPEEHPRPLCMRPTSALSELKPSSILRSRLLLLTRDGRHACVSTAIRVVSCWGARARTCTVLLFRACTLVRYTACNSLVPIGRRGTCAGESVAGRERSRRAPRRPAFAPNDPAGKVGDFFRRSRRDADGSPRVPAHASGRGPSRGARWLGAARCGSCRRAPTQPSPVELIRRLRRRAPALRPSDEHAALAAADAGRVRRAQYRAVRGG